MVSLIHHHWAWPICWTFLEKRKGSSNLAEQQAVMSQSLGLLSAYVLVVPGNREFCSLKLGKWRGEQGAYFCLRP